MGLSKTRYCKYLKCPKALWLSVNKSELNAKNTAPMRNGISVGELAKGYLGSFEDATVLKDDGEQDRPAMIQRTQELLAKGTATICEAAFSYNGCYCAVDLLHEEADGYAMYEVKSAGELNPKYLPDVAYQKYVLEHCGIKVVGTYLVHLNKGYVFDGTLDLKKLFTAEDVWDAIKPYEADLEPTIAKAEAILASDAEPEIALDIKCEGCDYYKYCACSVPYPSVLDLSLCGERWDLFHQGIVTYQDLKRSGKKIKEGRQRLQVEHELAELPAEVKKEELRQFLSTLTFPLYFLDFETYQVVVPDIVGTHPYQALPFQYSLHVVKSENAEAEAYAFLAEPKGDPRRALAQSLVSHIPKDVCVLAYHASVERGIVDKLAEHFQDDPALSEALKNISANILDLETPFKPNKNFYYCRRMGKYSSIKKVAPALYPDDPSMDYGNLEGVHDGMQAMNAFPQMKYMTAGEQEEMRRQLLDYCGLDTYAMVKIWRRLVEASRE